MGINDEYSRDAYIYELAYDSDDSDQGPEPLHPEDWQDWYSEELLEAWGRIREYLETRYIKTRANYPAFVEFVMYPSGYPVDGPTRTEQELWDVISRFRIISERVDECHFFAWTRQNIDRHCNV